jgi:hypothetical protein
MNRHLNNRVEKYKTGHFRGKGPNGRGRVKEGSKEGEYCLCTFYTRMNIEFLNLLKSPKEED